VLTSELHGGGDGEGGGGGDEEDEDGGEDEEEVPAGWRHGGDGRGFGDFGRGGGRRRLGGKEWGGIVALKRRGVRGSVAGGRSVPAVPDGESQRGSGRAAGKAAASLVAKEYELLNLLFFFPFAIFSTREKGFAEKGKTMRNCFFFAYMINPHLPVGWRKGPI